MRIVRSNPSWAARLTFVAIAAAAVSSAVLCLESTIRGSSLPFVAIFGGG